MPTTFSKPHFGKVHLRFTILFKLLAMSALVQSQTMTIVSIEPKADHIAFTVTGEKQIWIPSPYHRDFVKTTVDLAYRETGSIASWQSIKSYDFEIQKGAENLFQFQWDIDGLDSLVGHFDFRLETKSTHRPTKEGAWHYFGCALSTTPHRSPFGVELLVPLWRFCIVADLRSDFNLLSAGDSSSTRYRRNLRDNFVSQSSYSYTAKGFDELYLGVGTLALAGGRFNEYQIWIHGGYTMSRKKIFTHHRGYEVFGTAGSATPASYSVLEEFQNTRPDFTLGTILNLDGLLLGFKHSTIVGATYSIGYAW